MNEHLQSLFILSFIIICLCATAIAISSRIYLGTKRIVLALVFFLLGLYTLPVLSGTLMTLSATSYLIGSVFMLMVGLGISLRIRLSTTDLDTVITGSRISSVNLVIMIIASLLMMAVYFPMLARFFLIHPLDWDVMTYALPNSIHFWQVGTLWNIDQGFGAYYSYGYEMSIIYSIVVLQSEALMGLFHAWFVMASLLFAYQIVLTLTARSLISNFVGLLAVIALGGIPGLRGVWGNVGKNDVAITAFGLGALYFLLLYADQKSRRHLIGLGVCLGLMLATKATAFYYLIFFLLILLVLNNESWRIAISHITITVGLALPVGLPWYVRNWIMTSNLTDPELAAIGMERSILFNLANPGNLKHDEAFWLFGACVAMSLFLVVALREINLRSGIKLSAVALAGSVIIFAATPFSAYPSVPGESVQLRLSGIMIPLVVIMASAFASSLISRVFPTLENRVTTHLARVEHIPVLAVELIVIALNLLIIYSQFQLYRPPDGLPEVEKLSGFREPTRVYQWAQENIQSAILLNFGLRSYGLLGRDFSNIVFYRTHSYDVKLSEVVSALDERPISYLFISKDPHYYTPKDWPPVVNELIAIARCPIVYQDEQAVVFRASGCHPR